MGKREGGRGGGGREAERKVQVPAPGSQWKERERGEDNVVIPTVNDPV